MYIVNLNINGNDSLPFIGKDKALDTNREALAAILFRFDVCLEDIELRGAPRWPELEACRAELAEAYDKGNELDEVTFPGGCTLEVVPL